MPFPEPSKKQANILWMSITALAVAIFLGIIGVFLFGLGWIINRLAPVLLPLAVAAIVAYLLDPVVDWIEARYKLSRLKAIIAVFLALGVAQLGFIMTVVPDLIVQADELVTSFSKAELSEKPKPATENPGDTSLANGAADAAIEEDKSLENESAKPTLSNTNAVGTLDVTTNTNSDLGNSLSDKAKAWLEKVPLPSFLETSLNDENSDFILAWVKKNGSMIISAVLQKAGLAVGKVASLTGFIIGFAMTPVFVFFFLLEENRIVANWKKYLPVKSEKWREEIVFVLTSINDSLIIFFRGQVLVGLCLGTLIAIGFSLVGLKYALLLGMMAAVLSIIPYLGVVLSVLPALVIAIVQFQDWLHPLLVLLVFVLVQMAEGLVISPKIIGDRVGMHPLTIIVAVLIGTTLLGGIVGGVLAIPLTAALRAVMFRYVWKPAPTMKTAKTRKRRATA